MVDANLLLCFILICTLAISTRHSGMVKKPDTHAGHVHRQGEAQTHYEVAVPLGASRPGKLPPLWCVSPGLDDSNGHRNHMVNARLDSSFEISLDVLHKVGQVLLPAQVHLGTSTLTSIMNIT